MDDTFVDFLEKPTDKRFKDLEGRTYGRLMVMGYVGRTKRSPCKRWFCACTCGGYAIADTPALLYGATRSCGCLARELAAERGKEIFRRTSTTHGMCYTPEFHIWCGMRDRCSRPLNSQYKDYGGRGITVCDEWRDSFEAFYRDMGPRPSKSHTLERINNNGNYEPNNCRWATYSEQARNTRRNHLLTFNGKTQCLTEWAEEMGLPYSALASRIGKLKWPTEKALLTPLLRVHS